MPKLSIIVPVYNAGIYLHPCIESILSQSYRDFELILVDDGSTDESGNVCNAAAETDKRVTVIHQENLGVTAARRAGFFTAVGHYIGFVDSDDTIDPKMYETLMKEAISGNADYVVCDIAVEQNETYTVLRNQVAGGSYEEEAIKKCILPQMLMVPETHTPGILASLCPKVIRKELLIPVMSSLTNMTYGEDAVCSYSSLILAKKVSVVHQKLYRYRQVSSSATHNLTAKRLQDIISLQNKHRDMLHAAQMPMDQLHTFVAIHSTENIRKYLLFGKSEPLNARMQHIRSFLKNQDIDASLKAAHSLLPFRDQQKNLLLLKKRLISLWILFSGNQLLRRLAGK